jgi:hypothetical protein
MGSGVWGLSADRIWEKIIFAAGLAAIDLTGVVAIKSSGTNTAERAWAAAIAPGLCTALCDGPKRRRGAGRRRGIFGCVFGGSVHLRLVGRLHATWRGAPWNNQVRQF